MATIAPFDYTLPGVQSPFQALAQGMQFGTQMATADAQRQEAERRSALAQAQATAQRQALERQQMLAQAFDRLTERVRAGTATATDFQEFALQAPKDQAETAIKFFNEQSAERKAAELGHLSQVASALGSKTPDIGVRLLRERAEGFRNRGDEEAAKRYEVWAELAQTDPADAQAAVLAGASFLPGGDKVVTAWEKSQQERRARIKFPFEVTEAEAKANSAAVASKYAEAKAVRELEEKGWNIAKLQNDIEVSKQNARIAAMQAQLAREGNDLKRQELQAKLQEAQDKRDTTIREKAADLESARFNVDNMLNTATRILNTPKSVIGAAAGPISSRIITTSQATADLEELVTTLGSQSFLAQIPNIKGMGQLSNAEGEKLQAALQNFSLRQSPERLIENVKEAQRLLTKARKNMTARAGLPESAPDVPAAGGPPIPTTMQPPPAPGFTAATPALAPAPQMPAGFRLLPPAGR